MAFQQNGVIFLHEPHLVAKMPGHDLWMAFLEDLWMAFLEDPTGKVLGLMSEVATSAT